MAKEKEASAPSRTLSRLEHLITISFRTQTLFNDFHVAEVLPKRWHKEVTLVKSDLDIGTVCHRARLFFHHCAPIDRWPWPNAVEKSFCFTGNPAVLNIGRHRSRGAPTVYIRYLYFINVESTLIILLKQYGVDVIRYFQLVIAILVDIHSAKLWDAS